KAEAAPHVPEEAAEPAAFQDTAWAAPNPIPAQSRSEVHFVGAQPEIADDLAPADDFIAAARRAAQAAASRPNVLHPDIGPVPKPRPNRRFNLPRLFRKAGRKPEAKFSTASFPGEKPV